MLANVVGSGAVDGSSGGMDDAEARDREIAALRFALEQERAANAMLRESLQTLGDMVEELRRNKELLFAVHNARLGGR